MAKHQWDCWSRASIIPRRPKTNSTTGTTPSTSPSASASRASCNCERWVGAEDPKISIATYDLETLAVLQNPAYRAIAGANLSPWSKRVTEKRSASAASRRAALPGNQAAPASGATAMLMFAMNPVPEAEAIQRMVRRGARAGLAAVPGCLTARRYRIDDGVTEGNQRYLALYHLTSPEVHTSDAWKKAVDTPWTHRIRPQTRDRLRIVLKRKCAR